MHAIQAAHEGALAAARRTDDGGHVVGGHRHVDGLQRLVLAIPGVQSTHFDSDTHTSSYAPFIIPRLVVMRTAATAPTIKTIRISAPAQACLCQSSYGEMA